MSRTTGSRSNIPTQLYWSDSIEACSFPPVFEPNKKLRDQLPIETKAELFDMKKDVLRHLRFEEPSAEYQETTR